METIYFNKENAEFYETKNGFASLKAFIPPVSLEPDDDELSEFADEQNEESPAPITPPPRHGGPGGMRGGHGEHEGGGRKPAKAKKNLFEESEDKPCEWQDLGRVFFHKAFPFDLPNQYICVLDKNGNEYGIIKSLEDIGKDGADIVKKSLERKYYMPVITSILSLKEQFGYSYWKVIANGQELMFSIRDTYKCITRLSDTKMMISDVDGNRYLIEDVLSLDRKSYRKISLYL